MLFESRRLLPHPRPSRIYSVRPVTGLVEMIYMMLYEEESKGLDARDIYKMARALSLDMSPRLTEDKLSYPVGRIIILSEDSGLCGLTNRLLITNVWDECARRRSAFNVTMKLRIV
jgi:hypothetical protein